MAIMVNTPGEVAQTRIRTVLGFAQPATTGVDRLPPYPPHPQGGRRVTIHSTVVETLDRQPAGTPTTIKPWTLKPGTTQPNTQYTPSSNANGQNLNTRSKTYGKTLTGPLTTYTSTKVAKHEWFPVGATSELTQSNTPAGTQPPSRWWKQPEHSSESNATTGEKTFEGSAGKDSSSECTTKWPDSKTCWTPNAPPTTNRSMTHSWTSSATPRSESCGKTGHSCFHLNDRGAGRQRRAECPTSRLQPVRQGVVPPINNTIGTCNRTVTRFDTRRWWKQRYRIPHNTATRRRKHVHAPAKGQTSLCCPKTS